MPSWLLNKLKAILHQDDINAWIEKFGHLQGEDFLDAVIEDMHLQYQSEGWEHVPAQGRYFFVSNHPLGGLDGMILIKLLSERLGDVKSLANDVLLHVTPMQPFFLPINKHGSQTAEHCRSINEAYASEISILCFPAGLCSRRINGVIQDLPWQPHVIKKAVEYKRDVIPLYFSGRNTARFYNLSSARRALGIKANLEMFLLADEIFKQKSNTFHVTVGYPISYSTFDNTRTPREWVQWLRQQTYNLA